MGGTPVYSQGEEAPEPAVSSAVFDRPGGACKIPRVGAVLDVAPQEGRYVRPAELALMASRRRWPARLLTAATLLVGSARAQSPSEPPADPQAEPAAVVAAPQAAEEGLPIRSVEFLGLETITEAYVRGLIRSEPGAPYEEATVLQDVRRLQRTRKFDSVLAAPRVEDGQVVLVFELVERPLIVDVVIAGARKFKESELRKELPFTVGDPVDVVALQQGRISIEARYREAGYGMAEVSLDQELLRAERIVRYEIVEGPRVRVRKILFEGNAAIRSSRLIREVGTKTYIWIFRTGAYDPDQVSQDEASLRQFYRDQGYLEARVSHRLEFDQTGENLTIVFVVDEGARYRIRNLLVEGAEAIAEEDLRARMRLTPGEVLLGEVLRGDVKTIQTLYGEFGYIYASVEPAWVYAAEEAELVDLTITIREGPQFRVGRVIVRGNTQTKDKVVRREVQLFPEELFNLTLARESERHLRETGLFSEAKVAPTGEEPGFRNALVEVTESERTVQFLFGVGVTSDSGVVGNFSIENRNFDLFDWPRSPEEFFKGRSFRGAGQTLRLQIEPGTEFTRGRIDFFEPYLLDQPLSLGTSFYLFSRGREAYSEDRLGLNVSFGRRFREGPLKGWAGEIALRTEWVDIGDVGFLDPRDVKEVEGQNYISSVKGTLVRDRTDSRFVPTRGDRLKLAWEQFGVLGGEEFFAKATTSYNWYKTLRTDEFDRKSVLGLRGSAGFVIGDAPVYERFYAGGIGSLRGFEFRTVSPRTGFHDDEVGGEFMLLTGAEYTFPIAGKNLRGVLFTDMGTVEPNISLSDWRVSVGAGIRLYVDLFGPVPLEFDFAVPVAKASGDDEQIFSFFFGTSF